MAEERNLATVRAAEPTDEDVTKEELQRRMEEARESITQTVTEIKDTVTNQYQAVKESVTEALDWREQFRKRPIAFSVGALSVGFIVGYSIAGTFKGDGSYDEDEGEDYGLSATPASQYYRGQASEPLPAAAASRSYAAQAITGGSYGSAPAAYSSTADTTGEAEEPQGPGLIERFKSTKAYDRLEEEVGALGDRFINELSKTAQTVILPALLGKVKELFGVDLSGKESGGRTSSQRSEGSSAHGSSATDASLSGGAQSAFAGVNRGASGGGASEAGNQPATGGSSYATSENRGYGASAGGSSTGHGSD